jgi:hypothetical protein
LALFDNGAVLDSMAPFDNGAVLDSMAPFDNGAVLDSMAPFAWTYLCVSTGLDGRRFGLQFKERLPGLFRLRSKQIANHQILS